MRNSASKSVVAALLVLASALGAQAGGITNNFDVSQNFVANGVVGDNNWDGVYLGFGDLPLGGAGGSGNGSTTIADANNSFPGFLTLRTTRGDWAGNGADGFFLYKVVRGDFDVSVESFPPWQPIANQFSGLLVRTWNPDNSGAPYSPTVTNIVESYMELMRGQEFNIFEVRLATNGTDLERTFPDPQNPGTNQTRFWRIVRSAETNFTFYWKTNSTDNWVQLTNAANFANGVYTRGDLAGVPMQVGINHAMFSANLATTYYTDFELTGPNVNPPTTPAGDPSGVTSSVLNSNTVTVTWTPGAGSAGSLVVIKVAAQPIRTKPVYSFTYTGIPDFKSVSNLFGGGARVVYTGAGNSVDITGLGGSNNTYSVAVYSYVNSGSTITYNAIPATNNFAGPGTISSVYFGVSRSSIPAGGVALATVTATFSSGDVLDVTADPNTIWSSSNPNIALAVGGGITGVTNGSAILFPSFAAVPAVSNITINVYQPAFVETFTSPHSYVTNGVVGTMWDGVYLGTGDVPNQIGGNLGASPGFTSVMDANVTTNNALFMRYTQVGWEVNENDGNFLWKTVVGDFQAVAHIQSYQIAAFNFVGLMARLALPNGGAFGTTNATFTFGREDLVRWARFDEFGISTSSRQNVNGANTSRDQTDGEANNYWLLMVRSNNTFFYYKKANYTDAWTAVPAATALIAAATNQQMQVGIAAMAFANPARTAQFDYFILDATNILAYTPPTAASAPTLTAFTDSTIKLDWTPGAGSAGSVVVMRAGRPVNVQPLNGVTYTGNAALGLGSNLGSSNYVVYVGSGNTVTVSNLIPGVTYYASVFSYSGAGSATVYNTTGAALANANAIGTVASMKLILAKTTNVVRDGIAFYTVQAVYTSGITNDVTGPAILYFEPAEAGGFNTNGPGVFSVLTNGATFKVYAVYLNATNNNNTVVLAVEPTFSDNFNFNHDYLANDVGGTIWDGVYLGSPLNHPANGFPGGNAGGSSVPAEGITMAADANISSNGVLSVTTSRGGWEFGEDDGFLLLKNIRGDFQTAVHIIAADDVFPPDANCNVGLMARAASTTNGAPLVAGESWLSWSRFDLFGIQTDGRSTVANGTARLENRDGTTNPWLMLARLGDTFYFLERPTDRDPWLMRSAFTTPRTDLAGVPMQVGIQTAMFSANTGSALFERFILDGTAQGPTLRITRVGTDVVITWPTSYSGYTLQSSPTLTPGTWSTLSGATAANGMMSLTVPITGAETLYRLVR